MSIIKRKELVKCPDCGAERYTLAQFIAKGVHLRCKPCSMKAAHAERRKALGLVSDGALELGSVRFGPDIGKADNKLYVLSACPDCGVTRWISKSEYSKWGERRCLSCHNKMKAQRTVLAILKEHPEIKEIKWVSRKGGKAGYYHVFVPCPKCGVSRWTTLSGHTRGNLCYRCANVKPFEEVRRVNDKGYVWVAISSDSPYIGMARKTGGQFMVLEHRLVKAQEEHRPLEPSEQVHHIDGNRQNNKLDNLQLISRQDHNIRTTLCAQCPLRAEVQLLRKQLHELGLLRGE